MINIEFDKKPDYQIVKVDGFVSVGNQYDIDITLPEDGRDFVAACSKYFILIYTSLYMLRTIY